MRRLFIAGNWKMNKDLAGARELARTLRAELGEDAGADVGVFPPFVHLAAVAEELRGSRLLVGAQNLHPEPNGAFTGEVSGPMIRDAGATHVLIGHSERRQLFGETNEGVNRKLKAALRVGLHPIVCVGEVLEQRQAGETEAVVGGQVAGAVDGLSAEQVRGVVFAYEPVWAIGTGVTATPDQAQAVHAFLRSFLAEQVSAETAEAVRIQYGGSVKPANAAELLAQPDIDGALVGGASLDAAAFIDIVRAREA